MSNANSISGFSVIFKGLLASMVLLLSACAVPVVKDTSVSINDSGKKEQGEPRIVKVEPVRPKIRLDADLLYKILEAEFAGQRGHINTSLENYLELARETRDPKIAERATRIAVFAFESEIADEMARLWSELDPRNPGPHQVLVVMALRKGDVESSLIHLETILDYTFGDLRQKLLMVVNLLGREGEREVIIEVINKFVQTRQDSPEALFAFSHVASELHDYELALNLLAQTYTLTPNDDAVALGYVAMLRRLARTEEALAWLKSEVIKRREKDFDLRMSFAQLLTELGKYGEAQKQFEILIRREPDNKEVMFALSLLHLELGHADDAEEYLTRLSALSYKKNEVNYYLGRVAENREDYNQASIWYNNVRVGQNYFDSQVRLGLMLGRQGRYDDAVLHLNSIRIKNTRESIILVQAEAELMVDQKQYQKAMVVYDRALRDSSHPDLLYSRAMLAEKMDRLDILEADLRFIIKRDPSNIQALNALGYTLADRTKRYEEAELLIDRALSASPHDHYILDSKGWVLYRLGKLKEAIIYLKRALDIIPDAEIAAHLGEVLWVNGDRREAKKVWGAAMKLTPNNSLLKDVIRRFNP